MLESAVDTPRFLVLESDWAGFLLVSDYHVQAVKRQFLFAWFLRGGDIGYSPARYPSGRTKYNPEDKENHHC
jgi:hypothetical protein